MGAELIKSAMCLRRGFARQDDEERGACAARTAPSSVSAGAPPYPRMRDTADKYAGDRKTDRL